MCRHRADYPRNFKLEGNCGASRATVLSVLKRNICIRMLFAKLQADELPVNELPHLIGKSRLLEPDSTLLLYTARALSGNGLNN